MKVGIIVFSQTGHTLSVAKKLEENLVNNGQTVTLEQVEIKAEMQDKANKSFELVTAPSPEPYDSVVFAGPVEAFNLSRVMKAYLAQVPDLKGKNIAFLITQFFPYRWLGGKQAVNWMKKTCEAKNGTVKGSGIINRSNRRSEQMIADAVEGLTKNILGKE